MARAHALNQSMSHAQRDVQRSDAVSPRLVITFIFILLISNNFAALNTEISTGIVVKWKCTHYMHLINHSHTMAR